MLLTCALQEVRVITNQAPPHPIREESYTVGRSSYSASGRVVTMTTRDNSSDVTLATGSVDTDRQVRLIPLCTNDAITQGPLITIHEVKTPISPFEPLHGACDVISDVISDDDTRGGGVRNLDVPGAVTSVIPPFTSFLLPKSSLDELNLSLTPLPGWTSPSKARVV